MKRGKQKKEKHFLRLQKLRPFYIQKKLGLLAEVKMAKWANQSTCLIFFWLNFCVKKKNGTPKNEKNFFFFFFLKKKKKKKCN
jgi:hypothetical protein